MGREKIKYLYIKMYHQNSESTYNGNIMCSNTTSSCVWGRIILETIPGPDGSSFYYSDIGCRDLAPQYTSNRDLFWILCSLCHTPFLPKLKNILFSVLRATSYQKFCQKKE